VNNSEGNHRSSYHSGISDGANSQSPLFESNRIV
jgi:hypothetical protein